VVQRVGDTDAKRQPTVLSARCLAAQHGVGQDASVHALGALVFEVELSDTLPLEDAVARQLQRDLLARAVDQLNVVHVEAQVLQRTWALVDAEPGQRLTAAHRLVASAHVELDLDVRGGRGLVRIAARGQGKRTQHGESEGEVEARGSARGTPTSHDLLL
jgi:hypothetical protein